MRDDQAEQFRRRFAVTETGGPTAQPIVFVHGYATSQAVWRLVAPAFADRYRVICYDHAGAGNSDPTAWDPERHSTLRGYAQDLNELIDALELPSVIAVGHSAGGMIGALAAAQRPEQFLRLIMVAPSARYLDGDGYVGGFTRPVIEQLLQDVDSDFPGWARAMAPNLVGDARPGWPRSSVRCFSPTARPRPRGWPTASCWPTTAPISTTC